MEETLLSAKMIDFHSHILPQIDDGAHDMEESVALANMYVKAGFSHVTATPHCHPGTFATPDPQVILDKIDLLNAVLKEKGVPLTILQGMEIGIDPALIPMLKQDRILSLGGSKTLLLETPFQRLPQGWERLMLELKTAGYQVLMGHPERSAQLSHAPDICRQFVDLGLYLQVTWDSFLGNNGPGPKYLAESLILSGAAHVLATDSHHVYARNPGNVNEGYRRLRRLIGDKNAALLCRENPQRILQNAEPISMQPTGNVSPRLNPFNWRYFFNKG